MTTSPSSVSYTHLLYAPDGFVTTGEEQEFVFEYQGDKEAEASYEFVFEDEPTTVELSKTDLTTGEELPGARLQLTDENGAVVEAVSYTHLATDRHGVIYHGRIRRLTPRECLRLQGYRDGQISKMEKETSDNQLYKQAGNGVTVNVIEAIGRNLKAVDEEIRNSSPVPEAKGG